MKNFALSISAIALTAALFSACTDDSSENSNPANPGVPASSDSQAALSSPASSDAGIIPASSSEIAPASSAGAPMQNVGSVSPESIVIDAEGFADIQTVYLSLQENESAIFIVRHGEREPQITKESPLTEDGVEQSISVGQKLASTEEFSYMSTDFVRTESTCRNIALGRGQATFPYEASNVFTNEPFVKDTALISTYKKQDGDARMVIAKWAYDDLYTDAYNDLKETSEAIIADLIQNKKSRTTFICSHDEFLVPMIAYLTDKKTDLRIHESRNWLNYLAGVAIVTDASGNRRAYAVKGLESGLY